MQEMRTRKRNRLQGYDYCKNGAYFITICVKNRHKLLWKTPVRVNNGCSQLSEIGKTVYDGLQKMTEIYDSITVDKYIVMPDHLHLILIIHGNNRHANSHGQQITPARTISAVINQFKGYITKQIGYSVWQKSFHDHIIRNEAEYWRICQYIDDNRQRWLNDNNFTQ